MFSMRRLPRCTYEALDLLFYLFFSRLSLVCSFLHVHPSFIGCTHNIALVAIRSQSSGSR